jgi:type I restriction enzyme S subunit
MNKQIKKPLVPRLRFPEFQDMSDNFCLNWKIQKLGQISAINMGVSPRSIFYNKNGEGLPLLQGKADIKNRLSSPKIYTREITKKCARGDLILSVRAPAGYIAKVDQTCCIGRGIASIKPFEEYNVDFIFYQLLYLESKWSKLSQGGTFDAISGEDIKNFSIKIPFYKEQQKIADCLSSLDESIKANIQKLDVLKNHKKGLMQQLFPCEGETIPKLRFPEFQDAGEWEETSIGNVCKTFSGGTPSSANKKFYGGDIPFIRSAEINKEYTELFLTIEGLKNSSAKLVNKGDILFALYGANSGEVALAKQSGAINQAILCLRSSINHEFIHQLFLLKKQWIVAKYIQGGQGNLSGEIVKSINISLPRSQEQQKIADCLTSLDELIAAQSQKIEALKSHKKGLMQQLFPAIDEVGI